jgi:hypothetical protein
VLLVRFKFSTPSSPLVNLALFVMSSLAGALISPEDSSVYSQAHNDNDLHFDMKPDRHEEDEEMADLFGGEAQAEVPNRDDRQLSPADTSELSEADAEQRRALEYEEDDVPPEVAIEEREANVAFPNLPVPSSSDKNVRTVLILSCVLFIYSADLGSPPSQLCENRLETISPGHICRPRTRR